MRATKSPQISYRCPIVVTKHAGFVDENLNILIPFEYKTQKHYLRRVKMRITAKIPRKTRIDDSYTKIVVVRDDILPWTDNNGVQYINIEDFLLDRINLL